MDDKNLIPIQDWNMGGIADSRWSGLRNTLFKIVGWDLHSIPGIAKVAQMLVKDSGDTVDEFCKNKVVSTNGNTYWFSSESGKVWQEKAGVWTLVYTIAAEAGESKILGAREYQGRIWIATQNRLHYIEASLADGAAAWAVNFVADAEDFGVGDLEFHPMKEVNLVLYIGDGNQVAQIDGTTFSASAVDVKTPLRVKSLGKVLTSLLIGTYIDDNVNKTELFRWNTFTHSFDVSNEIDEVGVNAIINTDTFVLVQAGRRGRLYVYDYNTNTLVPYKTIPGEYSFTREALVHPEALAVLDQRMLIGVSKGNNKVASVEDDFDDQEVNLRIWEDVVQEGEATITEVEDGQIELALPATATDISDAAIQTPAVYNFENTEGYVQVVGVVDDGTNAVQQFAITNKLGTQYRWKLEAGTLKAQYQEGGGAITDVFSVTFVAATHAWWKIREAFGTVYWDSSEDGLSWTNRASYERVATDMNNMAVLLEASCYQNETDPGTAIFDNMGVTGSQLGLPNPIDLGVYQVARHSRDYPFITDLPYPISERLDGEFVLSNLEIGAIAIKGTAVYVSWKRGSGTGIDKLDYSQKLDGAYIETRVMSVNRSVFTNFSKALLAYHLMPPDTSIEMEYSRNYESYRSVVVKQDRLRNIYLTEDSLDATTLQLKITARTSRNDGPQLESAGVTIR